MKIQPNNQYPFFAEYHDALYITSHDSRPAVVVRDRRHRTQYRLDNDCQKEMVVYHIDGGMIPDNEIQKCDYGIYTEDQLLILVELKGADLLTAINQLASTVSRLFRNSSVKVRRLNARAVLSKVPTPAIGSTEEKKMARILREKFGGGTFVYRTRVLNERLS